MTEGYDCINDYIGKATYSYNAWGQLVNYNNDVGETASYTYYSDGLRASKTIGDNTTKYYYDGDNVINETLNNNNYATNVMGVNGYVSRRQNGTTGYLFKDAHGDVLSIYTSTSNKVADYTYDAWGEIRTQNESSSFENNPLRYYGQYYDYESNMTYLRARYYDSSIRRFITEDPAKDGSNWYAYCGNNPVTRVDKSGESWGVTARDIKDILLKYGPTTLSQVQNAGDRAKNNAINKAKAWGLYDNGTLITWDNRADALRHFQWNAVMTREIGWDVAQYVGDRHEINGAKDEGLFREENDGVVRMRVGQATLMDLWNNSVGRTLAKDSDLDNMNYDDLFYYAESNNLLITDVNDTFDFYGINDYVDWDTWTVGILYNTGAETITVMKDGLPDISLKVGVESWW